MGDWNVSEKDKDFISCYKELGLNDAILEHASQKLPPPTYDRGSNTIDIMPKQRSVIDKGASLPFG